jgi:hypothetical protein
MRKAAEQISCLRQVLPNGLPRGGDQEASRVHSSIAGAFGPLAKVRRHSNGSAGATSELKAVISRKPADEIPDW